MKRFALVLMIILALGCVRTQDTLFTSTKECIDKKHLSDPEDTRDEYDSCLILKDDELKSIEGCTKRCNTYCDRLEMTFVKSWPDFSGCHCTCKLKLNPE